MPYNFKESLYTPDDIPLYQNQALRHKFLRDIQKNGVAIMVSGIVGHITKRELNVAMKLIEGKTMKQIGELLFISPRTVETHMDHLKQKLQVKKRSELADVLRKNLID
ncbi:MAG: hypothetical protein COB66_01010 [Coxiella sp. (in: Bacteria)]|nr:MAG: hypothetical protein COB66_01010 [Coxiella sp. (in: g-proteobacteria)]